jgi:NAD(P)-dependent dehydrogenase (short-subunit alcohol dehydrogenase family)
MSDTGFDLDGQVIIVTGATRGIGRSMAISLARAGAVVVATGLSEEDVGDVVSEGTDEGLVLHPALLDVGDVASIRRAVADIVEEFGRIDALVNNAGLGHAHAALDVTESDWDQMMAVNLRGVFFACQAVAPAMIRQGGGRIVNISSQASFVALRDAVVYSTSKGGVNMMTKALAVEWAPHGINVNAVAPTFVYTPGTAPILDDPQWRQEVMSKIPLQRLATPDDVTAAVIYLAAPASRMVTGTVVRVDGGWTAQ